MFWDHISKQALERIIMDNGMYGITKEPMEMLMDLIPVKVRQ